MKKALSKFELFQGLKIVGCKLERVRDLEFDLFEGACDTYNIQNEEKVMLCFGLVPNFLSVPKRCDW